MNRITIAFTDGRELVLSYGVPVAGFVPGRGYLKTDAKYSPTTSKHANQGHPGIVAIPDPEFRALFPEIKKASAG